MIRCLLLFLWCMAPLAMQAGSVDSLRQVIASTSGEEKSEAYSKLYRELSMQSDTEHILSTLEEWAAYERQTGNVKKESKARWNKIAVLSNFCLDDALLAEAPIQMSWFESHDQWEYFYNTWECKAGVYLYSGRVHTALHEAELMLADAQQRNNDFGRVVSYQLTGMIYENMGQCEPAITNLQRALDLVKKQKVNSDIIVSVYDYLCQSLDSDHQYQRELKMTDEWKETIIELRKRNGDGSFIGTNISRLVQRANALMGLQRLDEAAEAVAEAKAGLKEVGAIVSYYRVLQCQARLYLEKKMPEQTLASLDSLQELGVEAGGSVGLLRGDAMMMLNRYKEAAELFRKEYQELDTIYNNELRTQLSELSTLHHIDETEMKNQLERNKLLMLIIAIVALALLLFIVYRHFTSKRLAQKNRELKETNEQLQLANKRVEDSSKMKLEFIKSISHEIRTPLNILSGFTQVITSSEADIQPEQLADIHQRINENTDRIVQLVNKMLDLSDANSQTVLERNDSVTARELVDGAIHMARIASTNEVVFTWDADDELADTLLKTHRKYAERALSCLMDNARKFTKKGMIAVRLLRRSDYLLFVIEDTGIGISPDQAEHIFEEFVQIDKYADGAGIGLTVARGIARRLGGDINLDTSYTAGARFIMSLPL